MELAKITLMQIIQLLIMISIGFLAYRTKLITEKGNKELSNIILFIASPVVIFNSYQRTFSPELLKDLGVCFLLSLLTFIVGLVFVYFTILRKKSENWEIEELELVFTNCGFVGIPLAFALLGQIGVFYVSAYLTAFNLILWTYGISIFAGKTDKKSLFKGLLNPNIFAVIIGLIFFRFSIKVPNFIDSSIKNISSMYVPMAMIIIGVSLGKAHIHDMLQKRVLLMSFYRLILIPIIYIAICIPLRPYVNSNILLVMYIAIACPSAATGPMFSEIFNKNTVYAAALVCFTTVASAITIPLIMYLQSMI